MKGVAPVDVPTKLEAAVVDSSVSLVADSSVSHVPEIRKVRWKRQKNVRGVLGVNVDDLVGGGNLAFQKAVQWLRTELEFGTWEQSRFRLSQEYNRNQSRSATPNGHDLLGLNKLMREAKSMPDLC